MKLSKAIKEAQKNGRGIARHGNEPRPIMLIPTNTTAGIIAVTSKNQAVVCWKPTLNDLIATDWFVFG
ncbi:MW1434 family type I TA system toxin [Lactiplantibacillus plantarum]|uniref:Thoeris anti-defense Tad2 family protein n=1 Tax=Lactiplantibacillus plantarum TaxID=1590 RepID=UPI00097600FE|nr:MW1434 family type I TA system toxin [Lactiplantibacillus plantarum]